MPASLESLALDFRGCGIGVSGLTGMAAVLADVNGKEESTAGAEKQINKTVSESLVEVKENFVFVPTPKRRTGDLFPVPLPAGLEQLSLDFSGNPFRDGDDFARSARVGSRRPFP